MSGPTGCGKTTLINLLMRFYDVDGGAIAVEGEDIRSRYAQKPAQQLRHGAAGNLAENRNHPRKHHYGQPGRDGRRDDRGGQGTPMRTALFSRLPKGYDTSITEDGGSLSQGQKQLLCIARVMLCLPPMLILDEATSSIDTRTELKMQEAFASPDAGAAPPSSWRTAFPPSGRRIRSLSCAMGTSWSRDAMRSCLKKGGFYAELYNSQFAH